MFTGLIEEMGVIENISQADGKFTLTIAATKVLEGTEIGDSIAVNGVCLTVTSHTDKIFTVDAVPETLAKTNLGKLEKDHRVNLERSATPTSRLGGHYVQGHVDGTGEIISITQDQEALWVKIKTPDDLLRYIAPKGYITVDGTSLTVVEVTDEWFTLTLIPHTQECIVLPSKEQGDLVNLEVDIIAKYVEKIALSAIPKETN